MNNIFLKPGQVFRVVDPSEILKTDYLIREMYERPMLSESGGWDTTFKGENWKGTAWHTIENEMPYWVGKTYLEFADKMGIRHEIIELINIDK